MVDCPDVISRLCANVLADEWAAAHAHRTCLRYVNTDGTLSELSYAALLNALAFTCDFLRSMLRAHHVPAEHSVRQPFLIGICVPESFLLPIWELAALLVGAAVVPIDLNDSADRLVSLLSDAQPRALVYPDHLPGSEHPTTPQIAALIHRAGLKPLSLVCIVVDDCSTPSASTGHRQLERCGDTPVTRFSLSTAECPDLVHRLLEANKHGWAVDPLTGEPDVGRPRSQAVSHVFFTSGSTGQPKGCIVTHASLAAYCWGKNRTHNVTPDSVCFVASPHTFDPSIGDFCACLTTGAAVAIAPRSLLFSSLGTCLRLSRSTHITTTPSLFETIGPAFIPTNDSTLSSSSSSSPTTTLARSYPDLRVVCLGGEMMSERLADEWLSHVQLYNIYGVTECMGYQTSCRVTSNSLHASLGQVLASDACRVFIVPLPEIKANPAAPLRYHELQSSQQPQLPLATSAPAVKRGEIWIAGLQVGAGYLGSRLSIASSEAFPQLATWGFCYRTGDLASVQPDGSVVLIGRTDWQVKIRGIRTEVGEIEAVLERQFAPTLVTSIAVVPVPSSSSSSSSSQQRSSQVRICAVVVPNRDCHIAEESDTFASPSTTAETSFDLLADSPGLDLLRSLLRQECHRRCVPMHMIPTHFWFANNLPITRTGKLNRKAVFELVQNECLAAGKEIDSSTTAGDEEEHQEQLSPTEALIANIWAEELGLNRKLIRTSSHFGALGGDSLAALRVCHRLAAEQAQLDGKGSASSSSGSEPNNEFGQLLGPLSPGFLLKLQVLSDFARHIESHIELAVGAPGPSRASVAADLELGESPDLIRAREHLYRAVSGNHAAVVDFLLQAYDEAQDDEEGKKPHLLLKEPTSQQSKTKNPVHLASFNGFHNIVRLFLAKKSFPLSSRDPSGAGLLHAAAHAPTEHAFTLIMNALNSAQVAKHQHPLFFLDENKQSVLHHAARFGAPLGVVRQICTLEETMQAKASKNDKSKAKSAFGKAKPMITWTDKWSRTPLHWASVNGHAVLVTELLRLPDVDVSARDSEGETALDIAERRARCGATDRQGERASKWGSIARLLGGSGTTDAIRARAKA